MAESKSTATNINASSAPSKKGCPMGYLSSLLNIRGSLGLPRPMPFEDISKEIKCKLKEC
jgi:hypothetical protein